MELKFKQFFYENIGAGSMIATTWSGSEAPDTMGLKGKPLNLPDIDIALPPEGTISHQIKKNGLVRQFIYNKDPITVILDDGTTLYFTYDEYKRIKGDKPIIPKLTNFEVIFQRLPTDLSPIPSKILACKSTFIGNNGQRKIHNIQTSNDYPSIQLF